jgi:hypothetical protein
MIALGDLGLDMCSLQRLLQLNAGKGADISVGLYQQSAKRGLATADLSFGGCSLCRFRIPKRKVRDGGTAP